MRRATSSDQGIDAGVGGDVDKVLVEFAPDNTERPLRGGVEEGGERHTDADEDQIGQRQTQHDRIGRRPQAMIASDGCDDSYVAEEPEHGDDTEDDRDDTAQHPANSAVGRSGADVGRVRLVSSRRVSRPVDTGTRVVVVNNVVHRVEIVADRRRHCYDDWR